MQIVESQEDRIGTHQIVKGGLNGDFKWEIKLLLFVILLVI